MIHLPAQTNAGQPPSGTTVRQQSGARLFAKPLCTEGNA